MRRSGHLLEVSEDILVVFEIYLAVLEIQLLEKLMKEVKSISRLQNFSDVVQTVKPKNKSIFEGFWCLGYL